MCIINNKLKTTLALEENVSFVPVQQKIFIIVDKFATFCVTFLTEVNQKQKEFGLWIFYHDLTFLVLFLFYCSCFFLNHLLIRILRSV